VIAALQGDLAALKGDEGGEGALAQVKYTQKTPLALYTYQYNPCKPYNPLLLYTYQYTNTHAQSEALSGVKRELQVSDELRAVSEDKVAYLQEQLEAKVYTTRTLYTITLYHYTP
jgi:hypothetical protein